jgi:triosephosphate isomerase
MPAFWIGTSWKMTKTIGEARAYARGLADRFDRNACAGVQPFIIPSFTAIASVRDELGPDSPVLLGAQNAHWEDAGAWTGEVSVPQATDAGASIIEIGHSERRQHFGETIETTRLKVAATLRHGLVPLLCIGEDAADQTAGHRINVICEQAAGALDGLTEDQLSRVLIAYEPVWAIGEHGRVPAIAELREPFNRLGEAYGDHIRGLLYGGSVSLDNAADLLDIEHVTGLFVGRAAWKLDTYLRLLQIAAGHTQSAASRIIEP